MKKNQKKKKKKGVAFVPAGFAELTLSLLPPEDRTKLERAAQELGCTPIQLFDDLAEQAMEQVKKKRDKS